VFRNQLGQNSEFGYPANQVGGQAAYCKGWRCDVSWDVKQKLKCLRLLTKNLMDDQGIGREMDWPCLEEED
jgi:hypothetical protein